MREAKNSWLTFAEAAERLGVTERTIKRWMQQPNMREALSAVQHGKQWRIPRPGNLLAWEVGVCEWRKSCGIDPAKRSRQRKIRPAWESELRKVGKRSSRYMLEAHRLWLAAYIKLLSQFRLTQKAREAILDLWHAANTIFEPLPRQEMEPQQLKHKFTRRLWRYWPKKEHFAQVRDAHTLEALEMIRQTFDFLQAVRHLRRRNSSPIGENLRHLLHVDFLDHINDTKEKLPTGVACLDFRQPQEGISRYQFGKRYPLKQPKWRLIITEVYGISGSIPSAEERHSSGKTPVRDSSTST